MVEWFPLVASLCVHKSTCYYINVTKTAYPPLQEPEDHEKFYFRQQAIKLNFEHIVCTGPFEFYDRAITTKYIFTFGITPNDHIIQK